MAARSLLSDCVDVVILTDAALMVRHDMARPRMLPPSLSLRNIPPLDALLDLVIFRTSLACWEATLCRIGWRSHFHATLRRWDQSPTSATL